MKRFYKKVTWGPAPGGYALRLDDQLVRTPLSRPLLLESPELVAAIAAEWEAQKENVIPSSMPMTQLANTMIDKSSGADREEMTNYLLKYGASDLVCYFADHPAKLTAQHEALWRPLLGWLEKRHDIRLETAVGIRYRQQPEGTIEGFRRILNALDPADFTVVQAAAGTTGSLVIALALADRQISAEEAWQAACVDELFQLETWGMDEQAQKRLDQTRKEISSIAAFAQMVKAKT